MDQKISSSKRLLLMGLIVFASVALCLGVLEVATRIYASVFTDYDLEMYRYARELKETVPDLRHHVHVANKSVRLMDVDIMTDSEGRRACPRDEAAEEDPLDGAVFLGDSVTLGWGVPAAETFACQIGQRLPNRSFVNAGVGNYNIEAILTQFENEIEPSFPELVIYGFYTNDIELQDGENDGSVSQLLSSSYFAAWVRAISHRLLWTMSGKSYEEHYKNLYQKNQEQFWDQLEDLQFEVENGGGRFIVMILPDLNLADQSTGHILTQIEEGLRKRSIEVLPVYRMEDWEGKKGWVSIQDSHPNPSIHKKIFEVFCKQYSDLCVKN